MSTNQTAPRATEPDAYTVEEAGRRLGISRDLAYRLAGDGTLPTLRLGKRLVVPRVQLERMLAGKDPA
jgi:excisionase family DNA binding protein